MESRLADLEAEVSRLARTVAGLEARLVAVERGAMEEVAAAASAASDRELPAPIEAAPIEPVRIEPVPIEPATPQAAAAPGMDVARVVTLVGRSLIALGGAYLLRNLTESGRLPAAGGVALGLAYALLWLYLSDRSARGGHPRSAVFYGLTTIALAFPILGEATTRFAVLPVEASAAIVVAVTAAAFALAWRRRLHFLAWAAVLAGGLTSLVLLVATLPILPYVAGLAAIGILALWAGDRLEWIGLAWVGALQADAGALLVTIGLATGNTPFTPTAGAALQLLVLAAFLVSFSLQVLKEGRRLGLFALGQSALLLGVAYGGAVAAVRGSAAVWPVGAISLAVAVACYLAAFRVVERRPGMGREVASFAAAGLVFALAGSALLLPGAALGVAWSVAAVAAALAGSRTRRPALELHGAVLLAGAAVVSGLLRFAAVVLLAPVAAESWPVPRWEALVVLAAAALALATTGDRAPGAGRAASRLGRLAAWAVGGAGTAALVCRLLAPLVAATSGGAIDPAAAATLRTAVLAAVALGLALAGRRPARREAAWCVYPLLAGGLLKLALEDLPQGRPTTEFLSLALFGAALIGAARLLRNPRPATG